MTKSMWPVHADAPVLEAARPPVEERSPLPVVVDDGPVPGGVDSGRLLEHLAPGCFREVHLTGSTRERPAWWLRPALEDGYCPVREVVQMQPEDFEQGASGTHAADLFMRMGVAALPVIESKGALVGVVRRVDPVVALATA